MEYEVGVRFRKLKRRLVRIEAKLDAIAAQLAEGMNPSDVKQVEQQATEIARKLEAAVADDEPTEDRPKRGVKR